ncbi:MAG: zinc ribbon domain-containing protein [Methanomassiliicoccus sp.]|nr:MAG: zinc ribbon domain-containing protein [Methanomassiliicoccus sp.]
MNQAALALGIILVIGGIGSAAWAYAVIHHIPSPEYRDQYDYDFWSAVELLGVIIATTGGVLAVIVLVAGALETRVSSRQAPTQRPLQPGVRSYCQHCGRQIAPDAVWCPGCGRGPTP